MKNYLLIICAGLAYLSVQACAADSQGSVASNKQNDSETDGLENAEPGEDENVEENTVPGGTFSGSEPTCAEAKAKGAIHVVNTQLKGRNLRYACVLGKSLVGPGTVDPQTRTYVNRMLSCNGFDGNQFLVENFREVEIGDGPVWTFVHDTVVTCKERCPCYNSVGYYE